MLFAMSEEAQAATWVGVATTFVISILAIFKADREAKNRRADKAQDADIALRVGKNERAIKRCKKQHRIATQRHLESVKHRKECEEGRKADKADFEAREREHLKGAHARAIAVAELQRNAGLPETVVIPPGPPPSGTHQVLPRPDPNQTNQGRPE